MAYMDAIQKVSYSHEALADAIIANPMVTQKELAARFGYTPGWISHVIASDAFQAYLATRKEQIIDPVLRGAVEESFRGLVLQSIEVLRRKLEANPSDNLAVRVLENSARALGYGARVQVSGHITHSHSLVRVLSSLPSHTPALEGST
jgi:hypothetical protein